MLRHHHATTTSQFYLVPEKSLNYTVHIYINIYIPTHTVCTLIMQPVSFQGSKHPVCRFTSLCCCSHSLCFVPYSPSSLSCSNWMCSRRISSQLLAGVESNSAHAAFSADRCRPIPYRAIFHPLEKLNLFLEGGTTNTERDVLLLVRLSVCWRRIVNVFPKKNGLLDQTCLTYLFSQRERDEDSIQVEKDAFLIKIQKSCQHLDDMKAHMKRWLNCRLFLDSSVRRVSLATSKIWSLWSRQKESSRTSSHSRSCKRQMFTSVINRWSLSHLIVSKFEYSACVPDGNMMTGGKRFHFIWSWWQTVKDAECLFLKYLLMNRLFRKGCKSVFSYSATNVSKDCENWKGKWKLARMFTYSNTSIETESWWRWWWWWWWRH